MSGQGARMCSEQSVWDGWRSHPCRSKAKVERDGKPWCGLHDPVARKARQDARGPSKWKREMDAARLERERIAKLETDLAAARAEAEEALEQRNELSRRLASVATERTEAQAKVALADKLADAAERLSPDRPLLTVREQCEARDNLDAALRAYRGQA